jgi:hypothetical protein
MLSSVYYQQSCPTCGRWLRIRVAYLGRKVYCQHCRAAFLASESPECQSNSSGSGLGLLRRAEELIEFVDRMNG